MADQTSARICPRCGKPIPAGSELCPHCNHRWTLFLNSRETVLTGSLLIVLILFFVTGAVTRAYHEKLHSLAGQWFARAEQDLNAGNATVALEDLRNALVYEPEDPRIQFRLAQALMAANRNEEARTYLEGLLTQSPTNAEVNLALARIAARRGNETDALRYYHGAIYGVWSSNSAENRLNTRLELCNFLVQRRDDASAEGELISLQSDIPAKNAASLHERSGELFLKVGDAARALDEFRLALRGPHAPDKAWKGAGVAEYDLGNFSEAERYLERASHTPSLKGDNEIASALEVSRLVQMWNPYLRGLTETQQRERARRDFAQAMDRLETCAKASGIQLSPPKQAAEALPKSQTKSTEEPANAGTAKQGENMQTNPENTTGSVQPDLATLYAQAQSLQPQLAERSFRRHPEVMDAAMQLAFSIETATAQKCGNPTGLDRALLEIQKVTKGGH